MWRSKGGPRGCIIISHLLHTIGFTLDNNKDHTVYVGDSMS